MVGLLSVGDRPLLVRDHREMASSHPHREVGEKGIRPHLTKRKHRGRSGSVAGRVSAALVMRRHSLIGVCHREQS